MPSKRTLQNYTYPEEEVENVIGLKKENTDLPSEYLKEKYDHFKVNAETDKLQYRKKTCTLLFSKYCICINYSERKLTF